MPLKWPFRHTKTERLSCRPFSHVKKVAKMLFGTFTISAVKALQDLSDLGLNKQGKKTATLPNITAILNKNGVQIQEIPSDRVRFCKKFCNGGSVVSAVCVRICKTESNRNLTDDKG